jgi:hypothetical protein
MVYDTTLEQLMFYIEGSWITLGKNTAGDGAEVGLIVPPFAVEVGDEIDGEAGGDQSGYSVSLSTDGTVVAIGAYINDGNGTDSDHVRVFK